MESQRKLRKVSKLQRSEKNRGILLGVRENIGLCENKDVTDDRHLFVTLGIQLRV